MHFKGLNLIAYKFYLKNITSKEKYRRSNGRTEKTVLLFNVHASGRENNFCIQCIHFYQIRYIIICTDARYRCCIHSHAWMILPEALEYLTHSKRRFSVVTRSLNSSSSHLTLRLDDDPLGVASRGCSQLCLVSILWCGVATVCWRAKWAFCSTPAPAFPLPFHRLVTCGHCSCKGS